MAVASASANSAGGPSTSHAESETPPLHSAAMDSPEEVTADRIRMFSSIVILGPAVITFVRVYNTNVCIPSGEKSMTTMNLVMLATFAVLLVFSWPAAAIGSARKLVPWFRVPASSDSARGDTTVKVRDPAVAHRAAAAVVRTGCCQAPVETSAQDRIWSPATLRNRAESGVDWLAQILQSW